jgi:hypothetical protein
MKVKTRALFLTVVLSILLACVLQMSLLVSPAFASDLVHEDVVGMTSFQRHEVQVEGLHYAFFYYSGSWYYEVGADTGNTTVWAEAVSLTGNAYDAVYYDGTYIRCAGVYGTGTNWIYYRAGTPNVGNGTITWLGAAELVQSGYSYYRNVSVCADNLGHAWISAYWNNSPSYSYSGLQIFSGSATDGTMGTPTRYDSVLNSLGISDFGTMGHCILPMDGDDVGVIFTWAGHYPYAVWWNGSSWSSPISSNSATPDYPESISCVRNGSSIDMVYLAGYSILKRTFDNASHTFSATGIVYMGWPGISYPVLSRDPSSGQEVCYWANYPYDDTVFYANWNGIWSGAVELEEDCNFTAGNSIVFTGESVNNLNSGVYWITVTDDLRYQRLFFESGVPVGNAIGTSDETCTSVTLNGYCVWDGNPVGNTTATFNYGGEYEEFIVTYGSVVSEQYINMPITGLVPNTVYFWTMTLTNENGSSTTPVQTFITSECSGTAIPVVVSVDYSDLEYTSVRLRGEIGWDGGYDCAAGFQVRRQGTEAWSSVENTRVIYNSHEYFQYRWTGLLPGTVYEWMAYGRNVIGYGYGTIKTFTTRGVPGASPTTGPGIPWPPGWEPWTDWIEENGFLVGILITILAVVAVAYLLRQSGSAAVIGCGVVALGLTILFTFIGWYPMWVILLIGAIAGLLIFFMIMRGR